DKENNFLLVFRGDDEKPGGLSQMPLSDERLNGHSVSRAEGFGVAPNPGYSPESADELQEVTLSESELSARQREVLELLSQGDSNQDIASKLGISPNTAKTHVRNIMSKLNAANRTQAALAAQTLLKKG
ncbi:MAG: helix-turn-helix domain-containing protein, partial [Chloroflexi bacterium]|nr:helix-turn-helix domain-containing protein [Chloroflexota bacterium]